MQIVFLIIFLSILTFFVKDEKLKYYCYIACALISSMYFLISFSDEFDLYRHYEYLSIVKTMTLKEINACDSGVISILYAQEPGYVFLLWIVSKIGIKELLPVFTGFTVYAVNVWILIKEKDRNNLSGFSFRLSFVFMLLTVDYLSISGIRNVLAATIFMYAFYNECILKERRVLSIVLYIFSVSIHTSIIIYIGVRILLFFYKKKFKIVINIFLLSIFSVLPLLLESLYLVFDDFPFIIHILKMYEKYYLGYAGTPKRRGMLMVCLVVYCLGLIIVMCIKNRHNEDILKLSNFYFLSALFTLGSFQQYDIFVRFRFIAVPFISVLSLHFFSGYNWENIFKLLRNNKNNTVFKKIIPYIWMGVMLLQAIYYCMFHYYPITQYITL